MGQLKNLHNTVGHFGFFLLKIHFSYLIPHNTVYFTKSKGSLTDSTVGNDYVEIYAGKQGSDTKRSKNGKH